MIILKHPDLSEEGFLRGDPDSGPSEAKQRRLPGEGGAFLSLCHIQLNSIYLILDST